jgi:NitT/TauT family transport system permease protein
MWQSLLLAAVSVGIVFTIWWFVTRQDVREDRIIGYNTLPSISETFDEFKSLWFERALTRNAITTIRRVAFGFGLACLVGIPLGVLAGCFTRVAALLSPLIIFGRNIPIAALIPLTFFFFGIAESQKIMFIFMASVAFIIADSSQAIRDVGQRYIDTARTLGASTWQIMMKVLVPLAMPSVFNSLRVLFGIAFGYIMLAEVVKLADEEGGLGFLIRTSQRQGPREHIYLIILIIPAVAFAIDRFLFWVQRELFPHRYGGYGFLNRALGGVTGIWDNIKCAVIKPDDPGPPKHAEWRP